MKSPPLGTSWLVLEKGEGREGRRGKEGERSGVDRRVKRGEGGGGVNKDTGYFAWECDAWLTNSRRVRGGGVGGKWLVQGERKRTKEEWDDNDKDDDEGLEGGRGGEREKEIEEDNTTSTKKQYDKKTHKNTKEQKGKTNNSIHDGPFEAVCDKLH